jgi:hypothetical protein
MGWIERLYYQQQINAGRSNRKLQPLMANRNALRITKTDLKIRPVYHRLPKRIEAHICLNFVAYKVYKELERQLKENKAPISARKAIEVASFIFAITLIDYRP